jgi:hypothetical protein
MSFGQDGVALRRQLRDSVPLHLGIIGCGGYPGERHAEGWLETGAVKLVAACDLSAPKLAAFRRLMGPSAVTRTTTICSPTRTSKLSSSPCRPSCMNR